MPQYEELRKLVESYMRQVSPGLYYSLEASCQKHKGISCVELLVEQPTEFKEVLEKKYGSNSSIRVVSRLIIYPIISNLKGNGAVDDFLALFLENPLEFKKRIREILS